MKKIIIYSSSGDTPGGKKISYGQKLAYGSFKQGPESNPISG